MYNVQYVLTLFTLINLNCQGYDVMVIVTWACLYSHQGNDNELNSSLKAMRTEGSLKFSFEMYSRTEFCNCILYKYIKIIIAKKYSSLFCFLKLIFPCLHKYFITIA